MTAKPIDTHIHLDELPAPRLDTPPYAAALVPGITASRTADTLARWGERPELSFAAGAHPWYLPAHPPTPSDAVRATAEGDAGTAAEGDASTAEALRALWDDARVSAIGELGLDYVRHEGLQERAHAALWCEWQLSEAHARGLPVVLHVVRAHDDMLAMLRGFRGLTGVVHAFGGSLEQAERYLGLGFAIGLGAAVTRERSTRVRRVATEVSALGYVLETDAPFMAAAPGARGGGKAEDILVVASTVARLRGVSVSQVVDESTRNAIERIPSLSISHARLEP